MAGDYDSPKRPAQTKLRLKNEVIAPGEFRRLVDVYHSDLLGVVSFCIQERAENPYIFQELLVGCQADLERLRDTLDHLIDLGENDDMWSEREELREALHQGYEHSAVVDYYSTGVATDTDSDSVETDDHPSAEELEEMYHEQREIKAGLQTVLESQELPQILEYIGENPGESLLDRKVDGGGEPWSRVASRELVPELASKDEVSNTRIEYELTDRGEAVLRSWLALKTTSSVQTLREASEETETRHIVLEQLAAYFNDFEM